MYATFRCVKISAFMQAFLLIVQFCDINASDSVSLLIAHILNARIIIILCLCKIASNIYLSHVHNISS